MNPIDIAKKYVEAINNHNMSALGALMTSSHLLSGPAGISGTGKDKALSAWRDFFEKYQDYKIIIKQATDNQGVVTLQGQATCLLKDVAGTVSITATMSSGKVADWKM